MLSHPVITVGQHCGVGPGSPALASTALCVVCDMACHDSATPGLRTDC